MDISNKTLAMFLLAAIVVSLGSTIFSMDKITKSPTGYATTATGTIDLSVEEQLSITTIDANAINFQTCTPLGGGQNLTINSETFQGASGSANCSSYTTLQNISVRNDGNKDANVTVSPDNVGEWFGGTFLPASSGNGSSIAYKITNAARNVAHSPGCYGTSPTGYNNFTNAALDFPVCSNLTYKDVNSAGKTNTSIVTDMQIVIPYDTLPGSDTVTLTYTANAIV